MPAGDESGTAPAADTRLVINRAVLDCNGLEKLTKPNESQSPTSKNRRTLKSRCLACFNPKSLGSFLYNLLPCISTVAHYDWKGDLIKDLVCGVTVGVMNIPQGMAYSILAKFPPVYGLYVSFFGPLFYAFLGRSPQLATGTFAVISLLLISPTQRIGLLLDAANDNITLPPSPTDTPSEASLLTVAVTLTFMIGILQLAMGVCRIGALISYLSPSMVNGFICGACMHVLASQIADLFGVPEATKKDEVGNFFLVGYNLIKHINKVNMVAFCISSATTGLLLFNKIILDPALQRFCKCSFSIPSELIVVVIGTVASTQLDLKGQYNVSIVGSIDQGMPSISLPKWDLVTQLIKDTIIIGITTTLLSISIVKMFAVKYNTKIEYNYEIYGAGIINIITCFFSSYVQSASVARCLVAEGAGARTPLNGIPASLVVLLVLLVLGPYFEATPRAVLAAIIVVALKNVFMKLSDLPKMYKTSRQDFLLYFIPFIVTVIFDVPIGLAVGILSCLIALTARQGQFKLVQLTRLEGTELFTELTENHSEAAATESCSTRDRDHQIVVFSLTGSLNFANEEAFARSFKDKLKTHQREQFRNHENKMTEFSEQKTSWFFNAKNWCCRCRVGNEGDFNEMTSLPNTTVVENDSDLGKDHGHLTLPDLQKPNDDEALDTISLRSNCITVDLDDDNIVYRFAILNISGLLSIDSAGADGLTRLCQDLLLTKSIVLVFVGDPSRFPRIVLEDQPIDVDQRLVNTFYPTLIDAYLAISDFKSSRVDASQSMEHSRV